MNHPLAKDIMVTNLVTLSPDTNVFEALRVLVKNSISGAPVVDREGNYLGVFSEKCCMRLYDSIARAAREQHVALPTLPDARQIMSTKLVKLAPSTDVIKAIGDLLKHHISGAPVVDASGHFLGVFSEKTSMSVLIQSAYEQLPSTEVSTFMNPDPGRTILEDVHFLDCAKLFRETPYRRLAVLRAGRLAGQVSRRDVLRNSTSLVAMVRDRNVELSVAAAEAGSDEPATTEAADRVGQFLDSEAMTITEEIDLLGIAQFFLHTPYRRLPVLRDGKLVGQVSRRDVLLATNRLMAVAPARKPSLLYLSALDTAFHH